MEEKLHIHTANVDAKLENMQASTHDVIYDMAARLERLELKGREASFVVYGIAEETAANAHLQQTVTNRITEAASNHGFTANSVTSARRVGRPNDDPRPVVVDCRSVADKHAAHALKGRSVLKQQRIILDDCLTQAQVAKRASQSDDVAHLKTIRGANPHWRGDRLFHIQHGRPVPYRPQAAGRHTAPQRVPRNNGPPPPPPFVPPAAPTPTPNPTPDPNPTPTHAADSQP